MKLPNQGLIPHTECSCLARAHGHPHLECSPAPTHTSPPSCRPLPCLRPFLPEQLAVSGLSLSVFWSHITRALHDNKKEGPCARLVSYCGDTRRILYMSTYFCAPPNPKHSSLCIVIINKHFVDKFIPQIVFECLLYAKHYSRYWG